MNNYFKNFLYSILVASSVVLGLTAFSRADFALSNYFHSHQASSKYDQYLNDTYGSKTVSSSSFSSTLYLERITRYNDQRYYITDPQASTYYLLDGSDSTSPNHVGGQIGLIRQYAFPTVIYRKKDLPRAKYRIGVSSYATRDPSNDISDLPYQPITYYSNTITQGFYYLNDNSERFTYYRIAPSDPDYPLTAYDLQIAPGQYDSFLDELVTQPLNETPLSVALKYTLDYTAYYLDFAELIQGANYFSIRKSDDSIDIPLPNGDIQHPGYRFGDGYGVPNDGDDNGSNNGGGNSDGAGIGPGSEVVNDIMDTADIHSFEIDRLDGLENYCIAHATNIWALNNAISDDYDDWIDTQGLTYYENAQGQILAGIGQNTLTQGIRSQGDINQQGVTIDDPIVPANITSLIPVPNNPLYFRHSIPDHVTYIYFYDSNGNYLQHNSLVNKNNIALYPPSQATHYRVKSYDMVGTFQLFELQENAQPDIDVVTELPTSNYNIKYNQLSQLPMYQGSKSQILDDVYPYLLQNYPLSFNSQQSFREHYCATTGNYDGSDEYLGQPVDDVYQESSYENDVFKKLGDLGLADYAKKVTDAFNSNIDTFPIIELTRDEQSRPLADLIVYIFNIIIVIYLFKLFR